MNILICNYNNYFNRKLKIENSILLYQDYATKQLTNINFENGDGVNTSLVVNCTDLELSNYLVCYNNNAIVSRWFILETDKIRLNQYKLTLKRDVLADFWNEINKSPVYIEKATLKANDPLILNSEGMTFNQIKTSETLLKNEGEFPWLAIYFSHKLPTDGLTTETFKNKALNDVSYKTQVISPFTNRVDFSVDNYNDAPYVEQDGELYFNYNLDYEVIIPSMVSTADDNQEQRNVSFDYNMPNNYSEFSILQLATEQQDYDMTIYQYENPNVDIMGLLSELDYNSIIGSANSLITAGDYNTAEAVAELLNLNGQIFRYGTNYYKYVVTQEDDTKILPIESGSSLNVLIDTAIKNKLGDIVGTNLQNKAFDSQLSQNEYIKATGKFIKLTIKNVTSDYNLTNSYHIPLTPTALDLETPFYNKGTSEAYDILLIPYTDLKWKAGTDINTIEHDQAYVFKTNPLTDMGLSKEARMRIATAFMNSNAIYDVQLIPYAPFDYYVLNNKIVVNDSLDLQPIYYGTNKQTPADFGVYLRSIDYQKAFNINIGYSNRKISNECDVWRLCSPNYSSVFEFKATHFTLNNDNNPITTFNVDIVLKPYQPYIHVYPNFDGLYGNNFNDARGLICEGDFSLNRLSDAYINYALQNKNYDAQFQRSIQNMSKTFAMNTAQSVINAGAKTAVQGMAGGKMFGPLGAVGGTLAGIADTGASLGFGIAQYKEAKDLAKDNFNYNLQNIQAMPTTLTKVTAFNQNNKIFPFIEYYTCTYEEKQALEYKLQYDGMTVNRIGYIRDYFNGKEQFIKGQLIRLEGNNDNNITNEIYNMLERGVYIYD